MDSLFIEFYFDMYSQKRFEWYQVKKLKQLKQTLSMLVFENKK